MTAHTPGPWERATTVEELLAWADAAKAVLDERLKEMDREIKATREAAREEIMMEPKLALHRKVVELERAYRTKRLRYYEDQDEIDNAVEGMIERAAIIAAAKGEK